MPNSNLHAVDDENTRTGGGPSWISVKATSNGSLHTANADQVPLTSVTPTVSSSDQAFQRFGDGSATIYYFRVLVNAGDDTEAQNNLSVGYPDVTIMRPNESINILSDAAITRVDIVAVGSAESATLSSGEVVVEATGTSTAADYGTASVTFEFDSADAVRQVRLHASDRQSNDVTVHVEGKSYA